MENKYAFDVRWHDEVAALVRNFRLHYYVDDGSIEMFDLNRKNIFLKRFVCEHLTLNDLYITGVVTVLGRQLEVTAYGNDFTKRQLQHQHSRTCVFCDMAHMHVALATAKALKHVVVNLVTTTLSPAQVHALLRVDDNRAGQPKESLKLAGVPLCVMEVMGHHACDVWNGNDSDVLDGTLVEGCGNHGAGDRARDAISRLLHTSRSEAGATHELELMFGGSGGRQSFEMDQPSTTATGHDCALCLVLPHAFRDGHASWIVSKLRQGDLRITAAGLYQLDDASAREFLAVYEDVSPHFEAAASHLANGACLAFEVQSANNDEAVWDLLQKVCGPRQPATAKMVSPDSIRARCGIDDVKNAVYSTDLAINGAADVKYFFSVLHPSAA